MERQTASLRVSNRARVIAALRILGVTSRADIARRTGLSRSTVSAIVAELEADGLVVHGEGEVAARSTGGGRPPAPIGLDPRAGLAVGIDFGKRHLAVAVADLAHSVIAERWLELREDLAARDAMQRAAVTLDEVLDEAGAERGKVIGVGMGLPGPIQTSGTVGSSAILPGWVGVNAQEEMAKQLGLPVVVENDANLGALAEHIWGAGSGSVELVYLKLATGIGAGLLIDGRLFRGVGGTAGEIGHTTVDPSGEICRCGNRGCLETFAGAPALIELLRRGLGEELTAEQIVTRAREGDSACRRALEDAGRYVGVAAANLCNLVNPSRIVVGGTIGTAGDIVLAPLAESLRRGAIASAADDVEIVPGELGERAELLGAVGLVLQDTSLGVAAGVAGNGHG